MYELCGKYFQYTETVWEKKMLFLIKLNSIVV